MSSHRSLRPFLLALLPLCCCSCLRYTAGWPPLPSTTYRGVVVDPKGRPVMDAQVRFMRTGEFIAKSPFDFLQQTGDPEDLGSTRTARDGTFQLTTPHGYATEVTAEKGDRLSVSAGTLDKAPAPRLPESLRLQLVRH